MASSLFTLLFPQLRSGGTYIIEDIEEPSELFSMLKMGSLVAAASARPGVYWKSRKVPKNRPLSVAVRSCMVSKGVIVARHAYHGEPERSCVLFRVFGIFPIQNMLPCHVLSFLCPTRPRSDAPLRLRSIGSDAKRSPPTRNAPCDEPTAPKP